MSFDSSGIAVDMGVASGDLGSPNSYGVILADPPWRFAVRSDKGKGRSPDGQSRAAQRENRPENHYPTMSLDDILALPVGDLAARHSVLFLWAVDPLVPQALEVGARWGFTFKTIAFVWAKQRRATSRRGADQDDPWHKQFPMGTGYWTRANPELCLLFTRGAPKRLSAAVRKLVIAPRREHSRKPDEVRASIERLVAGPYIELFARERAPGWHAWGNQVDRFAGQEPAHG